MLTWEYLRDAAANEVFIGSAFMYSVCLFEVAGSRQTQRANLRDASACCASSHRTVLEVCVVVL